MKCPEREEILSSFVDGELSPREQRRLAEHLMECDSCAASVGQCLAVRNVLHDREPAATTAPSPDFWHKMHQALDVMDAVATYQPPRRRFSLTSRRAAWVGALALALLLFLGLALSPGPAPKTPADLVAAHRDLVTGLDAQMRWWYTVEARPQLRTAAWIPQDAATMPMPGRDAPYTIYRERTVLITSFLIPDEDLDISRFSWALDDVGNFHYAAYDGHTGLVAWGEGDHWRVLIADVNPELLADFVEKRDLERKRWHDDSRPFFPELP
jgi:hypothetical protein